MEYYRNFGIGASDPTGLEHEAPWGMGSNNNRYQIDLNRDKWGMTQRETQEVAREFLRWNPQVLVDHHGETEQYFFTPPTKPVNQALPDSHERWYETFGRGNARAFDRHGWQYYARDVFDLYYPGYWDSWPSLHGAIGMTYETDAGGSKGLRWERQDGTVVTFRDGIEKHFVASMATAATAARNRDAILTDYAAFFRTGMEQGREGDPARAYLIPPGEDPRRAAVLASTLLRHDVELARAELDLTHWLTMGLTDRTLPVIASGEDFLTLSEEGSNPVVFPETGDLEVAGFTWPGNTDRLLHGAAWSVVEPVGEGQVVLFQADPNYRLVWRSTSRLFANAVLLGPTFAGEGVSRY